MTIINVAVTVISSFLAIPNIPNTFNVEGIVTVAVLLFLLKRLGPKGTQKK